MGTRALMSNRIRKSHSVKTIGSELKKQRKVKRVHLSVGHPEYKRSIRCSYVEIWKWNLAYQYNVVYSPDVILEGHMWVECRDGSLVMFEWDDEMTMRWWSRQTPISTVHWSLVHSTITTFVCLIMSKSSTINHLLTYWTGDSYLLIGNH